MITVTLLGTAALMPTPERALAAAAVSCGGRTVLFDCGEGTQVAARRAGVSPMRADLIALTHYHGDHIFGLPGLLQTLHSLGRTEPLTLTGPRGLGEVMVPILRLAGMLGYPVRLLPMPEAGLSLADLHPAWPTGARLAAFPTEHRVPSQGYAFTLGRAGRFLPEQATRLGVPVQLWSRLQRGETVEVAGQTVPPAAVLGPERRGLKVVFSGDTMACPALTQNAAEADLLICEATYATPEDGPLARQRGHMTFPQAAQTARDANAKALWLTHFSQSIQEPEACLPVATELFPETVCGVDGMSTVLRFVE